MRQFKQNDLDSQLCPVCGLRIYDSDYKFCSTQCSEIYKYRENAASSKEIDVLMCQYKRGGLRIKNWDE